ncbi:MAG: spore coat protein [Clostridiales bacterium]|nr:spore coat protein [Clostridiales bacterium]
MASVKKKTDVPPDQVQLEEGRMMQQQIAEAYNMHVTQCASQQLRDEFLDLLREEHLIDSELFQELEKRGWASAPPADSQQAVGLRQQFQPSVPRHMGS